MTAPRRLALAALPLLLLPELAYWLGWLATDRPGARGPRVKGGCAVLVLGYPPRADGTPHPMQRLRVSAAARVMREGACGRMVISGGSPHSGELIEAEVMAGLAREEGVPAGSLVLERKARNTWENVEYSLPYVETYPDLYIVSDSLHAHRGRRYLCKQRADRCYRAKPAADYRFGRMYFLKWPGALHEGVAVVRDALFYR